MIADDFDFEPSRGLPGPLPAGENLLWQGAPRWPSIARTVYHVPQVTMYFAALIAFGSGAALWQGRGAWDAAQPALWLAPLGGAAIGILLLLSWLTERTTVYSITSRRVVMRFGIALPITLNLPYTQIGAATLKTHADGSGDLPFELASNDHLAYLVLWPHARPWRISKPQPMFRCVPNGADVARVLAGAVILARRPAAEAQNSPETAPAFVPDNFAPAAARGRRLVAAS